MVKYDICIDEKGISSISQISVNRESEWMGDQYYLVVDADSFAEAEALGLAKHKALFPSLGKKFSVGIDEYGALDLLIKLTGGYIAAKEGKLTRRSFGQGYTGVFSAVNAQDAISKALLEYERVNHG